MSSLETVQSLQRKLLLLDLLSTARLSKSLATFASQMEPKSIVHFFKCMDSNCDYTTNNSELFLIHLSAHWEHSFLCTYCTEVICSDVQLVQHMTTQHGARVYQCALCFFRSRTKSHLIVHSMSIHKSRRIHGYFCSKVCDLPAKAETGDSVGKSYACFSAPKCRMRCFSTERFLKHVKEAHPDATSYTCHKCRHKEENPEGLIAHYAKVHNFMSYQCLYCNFGCDNEWPVMEHIAQEHADNPFKLLIRSSQPPDWFKELNTLTRESKLDGLPNGVQSSCSSTDKCLSPPSFEREEKPPIIEELGLANGLQSSHSSTDKDPSPPSTEIERKPFVVEGFGNLELEAMAGCSSALPTHFACQVENCSLVCNSAVSFINHMDREHVEITELSCPNCSVLSKASARELFVHLIDNHTALLRCPYSSCSFVGQQQEAVDAHIIAVHLRYEAECSPEAADGESCNPRLEGEEGTYPICSSGCHESLVYRVKAELEEGVSENTVTPHEGIEPTTCEEPTVPAEWLSDRELKDIAKKESCNLAKKSCDDADLSKNFMATGSGTQADAFPNTMESIEQLPEDVAEVYVCSLCCQSEMDALVYFRHMSLGHGVRYFCGHCEKGYKMPKQLLIHHSKFHDEEKMSFKTFQDNSLMDVPQKIISLWQRDIGAPKGRGKKKNPGRTTKPSQKATPAKGGPKSIRDERTSSRAESSEIKSDALSSESCSEIKVVQKKKRGRRVLNRKGLKASKGSVSLSEEGGKHASLESSNDPIINVPKTGKSPKQQSSNKATVKSMEDDINQKLERSDEAASPSTSKNVSKKTTPQSTPVRATKQNSLQTSKRGPKSSAKKPKNRASSLENSGKVGKAMFPVEKDCHEDCETSKRSAEGETADNTHFEEMKFRNSQTSLALCPNNLHVCVYCYKSYKLLKWAVHHQKAMHPDQPPMVKKLDFAKLDEVIKEGKSMVPPEKLVEAPAEVDPHLYGSTSSEVVAPLSEAVIPCSKEVATTIVEDGGLCMQIKSENDTQSIDGDSPPEVKDDFDPQSQKSKRWRRISVLSSDSGDDDEPVEEHIGFSYYGIKVEPMPTENIFVYVQNGGVRLAYTQLASLLNLYPRVVLQKIEVQ